MCLKTERQWDQVVLGGGPYLLGWTPSRVPNRRVGDPIGGLGLVVGTIADLTDVELSGASRALAGKALQSLPLHELPAGTELSHFGTPRARLTERGLARVVRTAGPLAYVVAAADASITVEGWLPSSALGRLVPARPEARRNVSP